MATVFDLLIQTCGLSHREAAGLLDVRPDTVASWASGRRTAPAAVLAELSALAGRIEKAATEMLMQTGELARQNGAAAEIQVGVAADDEEARSLGWPCVGAHAASIGLTVARGMVQGYRFRLVPRGSIPGRGSGDQELKSSA